MELISPTDFAKEKVQSVQEYAMLAARSIGNLFKRPLYFADMIQQADLIGFGSCPLLSLPGSSPVARLRRTAATPCGDSVR